ncbi:MAG: NAD(P)H-dependent glycerol-3-phosphate dehydrogenase [Planctomycetota bacterium]
MPRPTIAIIGDGQMGLVCADILTNEPMPVRLWSHTAPEAERLAQQRTSERLPDVSLPEQVLVTGDDAEALAGADLIVSAVPTQFVRPVWERLRPHVDPNAAVVSVAKGVENDTLLRPTQVIADALGESTETFRRPMCVLSGPTIAPELARCLPATMIAASTDDAIAQLVQQLFSTSWLRIYTGTDPVGVELAGATKNVIAIAAGILDGLQAGFNAKSALLARGLAETTRLGAALGARTETFFGLAGVGDLATTCFSPLGRNRSLGEALGKGESLESYLTRTSFVVEGVATTTSVVELARRHDVEMPITEAVQAVLYGGLDPIDAITRLMSREPKAERVGTD